LGWLNAAAHVEATRPFALDQLLLDVIEHLRAALSRLGVEVAHLKAIGLGEVSFGVANLVSSGTAAELSMPSGGNVVSTDLIVNARAAGDPAELERETRRVVAEVVQKHHGRVEFRTVQSFRPGRPQPTHRYASAK
jgi:hypothetical protein